MPRGPDQIYLEGLDSFTDVTRQVPPSVWERPSPCAEWTALDVLGHVGCIVRFGTELIRGDNPTWRAPALPHTAVEGEPGLWWEALVAPAREVVRAADMAQIVESPRGQRTIGEGLAFPAVDLFVHGWDLGRCAGLDVEIPDEVISFAHATIDPIPPEHVRSPRVFGTEYQPRKEATHTQSFLAWTGRDPHWTAPR